MSEAAAPIASGSGPGLARVLSDERLARRAARGDEHAFAAIFDRYHQRLYRYCLAIVGRSEDAQDALQNTMVKALRALPGEERRIELKPWLYRVAHNESIDLLRRRREGPELDPELESAGSSLADEAAVRERLGRLLVDLEALPERQRGALIMRELAGLDFAEIGTALGTSGAVARQTLYEARLSLRQMDEGREMSCETVTRALSDGDGRVARRRDIRAHLRTCPDCRRFGEEIAARKRDLGSLSPLPAVAAAGLLQSLLGGAGGGGGGGLAAALGGGAAKTLGGSTLLKGAATVAVVAAVGVGAADRGGLVDLGAGAGGDAPARPSPASARPAGTADPAAASAPGPAAAGDVVGRSPAGGAAGRAGLHAGGPANPAAAGGKVPGSGSAAATAPSRQTGSAAHPHGKGHEKQHPSAAAHGQQTAATHKAGGEGSPGKGSSSQGSAGKGSKGKGSAGGAPAGPPPKPAHPAPPPKSGGEKAAVAPPPAAAAPGPEKQTAPAPEEASGESAAPTETDAEPSD